MTEQDLDRLGIHRIPIPVPFPQAGGPVNAYAIEEEGGGFALFDTGLGTETARGAFDEGLRGIGLGLEDVRRVVISHGHVDHFGNAQRIAEQAGAAVPIYVHPADAEKLTASPEVRRQRVGQIAVHFERLGVPSELLAASVAELERGPALAGSVREVQDLRPGELLRFAHFSARVLHMPGHTPGLVCLWDEANHLLFSSDHLLERVSPNPLIDLDPDGQSRFRPLVAYAASVAKIRELDVELVLPGHALPFTGHRAIIDGLSAFYEKRRGRLRELLGSGPRSAWELSSALFPRHRVNDLFLILSETVANLELMEDRGEVARSAESPVQLFELLG